MNKMMLNSRPGRGALAVLLLSAAAFAGPLALSRAQPSASGAGAPDKDHPAGSVRISNPGGEATVDLANGVRHMKRNVQVWQEGEDFILYADDVTHYEKDNTATARLNLHVESRDSTIIGDLLRVDFNGKVMTLTGHVVLKSHGQGDGLKGKDAGNTVRGQVLHKASSVTCDRLDYDYETKQATLTGSIRMRQGENVGTCDRILFDEDRNIVRLVGNVHFANGDRQTIVGPEATIWIDSNMIQAPNTVIAIPGRNNKPKGPARKGARFDPAPVLPPDILDGKDNKPLPPLAPLPGDAPPAEAAAPAPVAAPAASAAAPKTTAEAPAAAPAAKKG